MGNKSLKRVVFIKKFIEAFEDKSAIMFVFDEMGIGKLYIYIYISNLILLGTDPLRHYAYSHVGTPAILEHK